MKKRAKKEILKRHPELELTAYGDFIIKKELVEAYEIVDSHAHIYLGTRMLTANYETEAADDINMESSFFDLSFFTRKAGCFDLEEEFYKYHPPQIGCLAGLGYLLDVVMSVNGLMRSSREATSKRIVRDMADSSISASVVLPLANADKMDGLDRYFTEAAKYDNLIPFGSVHPLDKDGAKRINYSVERGAKGFKLHPSCWKIAVDDEVMIELIKKIDSTGLPIVSCSGLAFPERYLKSKFVPRALKGGADFQQIERFRRVVSRFPETKFILAHGGGGLNHEVIRLMRDFDNVYTDISSQPPANVKKMLEALGDERFFYGSDYPVWNHAFAILTLLKAVQNEESRRRIFSGNIKKVLGIS